MPYKSRAQMRWAFANHEPWAKEWADKTRNPKGLPEHAKKAGDLLYSMAMAHFAKEAAGTDFSSPAWSQAASSLSPSDWGRAHRAVPSFPTGNVYDPSRGFDNSPQANQAGQLASQQQQGQIAQQISQTNALAQPVPQPSSGWGSTPNEQEIERQLAANPEYQENVSKILKILNAPPVQDLGSQPPRPSDWTPIARTAPGGYSQHQDGTVSWSSPNRGGGGSGGGPGLGGVGRASE